MYFTGIIIALSTFLIIGIFHPIVVKTEYYFGTRFWFVLGASLLWSIGELFEQKKRVEKGWFPRREKK